MLYRPNKGRIKDGCMVYKNGKFYLYSMYLKDGSEDFRHVWLATSTDGIHFEDVGCVVEDFPDFIWAMKVYQAEDAYYMNSGSFTHDGLQAVLKFWRSEDLVHWEYQPDLDVIAPNQAEKGARLDCMNVLKKDGKYYGYATGQYGFLTSPDGVHWTPHESRIDCTPFPPYNSVHGGFEIADFVEVDDRFYLLCGGFGHIGMSGYGVYLYESDRPDGTFTPCLPYYRINGTSRRWVNMWERCFEKDGELLAHNYMYDGFSYEKGQVYLPPIKRLLATERGLCLGWWKGNDALVGAPLTKPTDLSAEAPRHDVFTTPDDSCTCSEQIPLPAAAVVDLKLTLTENRFIKYSAGGFHLAESEQEGSAVLFDTYGSCKIVHVKDGRLCEEEDVIGFGSTAPYYTESGKTYEIRVLIKNGLFEIYVDGKYLQTFNNAHTPDATARPITGIAAIAQRSGCTLNDITVYEMKE